MEKKHTKHSYAQAQGNRVITKGAVAKRIRLFHFTVFNWTQETLTFLRGKTLSKSYPLLEIGFQSEVTPTTKREHLQGYVYFKNPVKPGQDLYNQWPDIHIKPAYKPIFVARQYAFKTHTHDGLVRMQWRQNKGWLRSTNELAEQSTEAPDFGPLGRPTKEYLAEMTRLIMLWFDEHYEELDI